MTTLYNTGTAIRIAKITSTIGLGLAAAFLPTLPLLTLPRINQLPSPAAVANDLETPRDNQQVVAITVLTADVLLLTAYFASQRKARHPYILYTAALGLFTAFNGLHNIVPRMKRIQDSGKDVNGEQLSRDLDDLGNATWISSALCTSAFVISLVGVIGDRY